MPLYTIATQAGTLDDRRKASLAAEIAALHVELAGVPANWVHVLFQDYAPGSGFTAGKAAPTVSLSLSVRTGRTTEYTGISSQAPKGDKTGSLGDLSRQASE